MLSDLPEATPLTGPRVGIQTLFNWSQGWSLHSLVIFAWATIKRQSIALFDLGWEGSHWMTQIFLFTRACNCKSTLNTGLGFMSRAGGKYMLSPLRVLLGTPPMASKERSSFSFLQRHQGRGSILSWVKVAGGRKSSVTCSSHLWSLWLFVWDSPWCLASACFLVIYPPVSCYSWPNSFLLEVTQEQWWSPGERKPGESLRPAILGPEDKCFFLDSCFHSFSSGKSLPLSHQRASHTGCMARVKTRAWA